MARRSLERIPGPAAILLVALVYYAFATLGLKLALPGTNATPVWPPSGLAFAALILLGSRAWPGVALGAFLVNVVGFISAGMPPSTYVPVSAAIAIGNAMEAVTGLYLLRHLAGREDPFLSSRRVFSFLAAAILMCAVSASVGPTAEALAGLTEVAGLGQVRLTWWLGDLAGVLAITPLILSWASRPPRPWTRRRSAEAVLHLTCLVAACRLLSLEPALPKTVLLPFYVWSVFRFGLPLASVSVALSTGLAASSAAAGAWGRPERLNSELLVLQTYFVVMAATVLVMNALLEERRSAQEEIRGLNRLLESKVRRRTAQLAAVNADLESFDYSVAHDLRAPLRSIDNFSKILSDDYASRLDERGVEFLSRIRAACGRMARLIDGLLRVSVSGSGTLKLKEVDLSHLAREIFDRRTRSGPARTVRWKAPEKAPVRGDPDLLGIVMENLIDNAYKFTEGRDPAIIEFGVKSAPGGPVYFLKDNGIGFDTSQTDRLFGIFERLHDPARYPGTGVGLAQVLRLVRRHGGRAWAEGAADVGAIFYFTLAAEPPEPPPA
jgi:signal transduction histidine kinase